MLNEEYNTIAKKNGMWLSLVERCVRDAKAAGSNPVTSTSSGVHEGARFSFFVLRNYSAESKKNG